jgi:hypothetical protein
VSTAHAQREAALLGELLHERDAEPQVHVPVDEADVVARVVRAVVRELDPAARF